jgi:hypothetical protein
VTTPAERLDQLQESLRQAESTYERQPDDLKRAYQETAQAVANALIKPVYSMSVQLPPRIVINDTTMHVPPQAVAFKAGSLFSRIRQRDCRTLLIRHLTRLASSRQTAVAQIAQLVNYKTGQVILNHHVPSIQALEHYRAFSAHGDLLETAEQAAALVEQLCQYVLWFTVAEQLYPGWTADDKFSERYAHLTSILIPQGRALAQHRTTALITELKERSQRGEITRGLTVLVPYLDERIYRMTTYPIEIIPAGRIPFRPEFILAACRMEQQRIRKHPQLSQATRWQLISQLDLLIQAFEPQP